jgi:hypothetical protein
LAARTNLFVTQTPDQIEASTTERPGTLHLIGVACLIVFGLFVILSVPLFWGQIGVLRSWPVRQAVVTRSDVVTEPAGKHDQLYSAHIEIAYAVDGQPVTSELTSFQSSNYQQTVQRAAEFPVGSRHAIRYDPKHPKQARIGANWNRRFFAVPLITLACGSLFGLLAAAFFSAARCSGAARAAPRSSAAS